LGFGFVCHFLSPSLKEYRRRRRKSIPKFTFSQNSSKWLKRQGRNCPDNFEQGIWGISKHFKGIMLKRMGGSGRASRRGRYPNVHERVSEWR
jgi:hypothetical protein